MFDGKLVSLVCALLEAASGAERRRTNTARNVLLLRTG